MCQPLTLHGNVGSVCWSACCVSLDWDPRVLLYFHFLCFLLPFLTNGFLHTWGWAYRWGSQIKPRLYWHLTNSDIDIWNNRFNHDCTLCLKLLALLQTNSHQTIVSIYDEVHMTCIISNCDQSRPLLVIGIHILEIPRIFIKHEVFIRMNLSQVCSMSSEYKVKFMFCGLCFFLDLCSHG